MPVRLCSRCHGDLPTEVTGDLLYCPHCGAPQVILSEELREQFEQQQLAAQNPEAAANPDSPSLEADSDPAAIAWAPALQLIALGGGIFALLLLVAVAFPPLGLLALLWTLGAPIVLMGIYASRNPLSRITTRFGARFGMLTGLMIGFVWLVATMVNLLVLRFVFHHGGSIDQQLTSAMDQLKSPEFAKYFNSDPSVIQQAISTYAIPEFRAGLVLVESIVLVLLYAFYSTLAGAFAGLLRSRARIAR